MAGGKTGGHLFPGIAVAEEFKGRVFFIGVKGGLEESILPKMPFGYLLVKARGFEGTYLEDRLKALLLLIFSTLRCYFVLKGLKPRYVLGVGGYSSVPACLAAFILKIPVFIHEQNSIPGKANLFISRFSRAVCVSFHDTLPFFRDAILTGNPLRKSFLEDLGKEKEEHFSVLFLGGSQGARFINAISLSFSERFGGFVKIYHQTGKRFYGEFKAKYSSLPNVEVFPFSQRIGLYYKRASLVVSRAGASTVFEIAASKRPSILIPFPYAASNHQFYNAKALERLGGAFLEKEDEFSFERFCNLVMIFRKDTSLRRRMGEMASRLFIRDAASRILEVMENA